MTFDFLGQAVYCPSLRVADDVPVLLECRTGIPVAKLTLHDRKRHTLFEQFACPYAAKTLQSGLKLVGFGRYLDGSVVNWTVNWSRCYVPNPREHIRKILALLFH